MTIKRLRLERSLFENLYKQYAFAIMNNAENPEKRGKYRDNKSNLTMGNSINNETQSMPTEPIKKITTVSRKCLSLMTLVKYALATTQKDERKTTCPKFNTDS